FDRAKDFLFVHDFALRAAPVGFVTGFLGLLYAVEYRQRAFLDPLAYIALQVFVEAIVTMRSRMTDVFDLQFAFAEAAFQREHRGIHAAAEHESRSQVGAFES